MKSNWVISVVAVFGVLFVFGCNSGFKPVANGADGGMISGTVTIDSKFAKKIPPHGVVFIMAKPQEQGPPVAVKRLPIGTFPLSFELMKADVMMSDVPFQGEFFVVVRIDQDGLAGPAQKGDLEGKTKKPIPVGHPPVSIKVDKIY